MAGSRGRGSTLTMMSCSDDVYAPKVVRRTTIADMVRIGVRQLRTELSHWIEQARLGSELIITERGVPVARLVPLDGESPLERMIRDGLVTSPRISKRARLDRPVIRPKGGTVAEILERQRRDRPW